MNVTEAVQQHLAQATSHIHVHKYPHRPGDTTLKQHNFGAWSYSKGTSWFTVQNKAQVKQSVLEKDHATVNSISHGDHFSK